MLDYNKSEIQSITFEVWPTTFEVTMILQVVFICTYIKKMQTIYRHFMNATCLIKNKLIPDLAPRFR